MDEVSCANCKLPLQIGSRFAAHFDAVENPLVPLDTCFNGLPPIVVGKPLIQVFGDRGRR